MKKNVRCAIYSLALLLPAFAAVASAQQYSISTVAGIPNVRGYFGDAGPATSAQLTNPARIAIDSKGNYYIADYSTLTIRKVDTSGNINRIAGTGSAGYTGDNAAATSATIGQVHGLAANAAGDVFFADMNNNAVRKITASTGIITTIAGTGVAGYSGDGSAASKAQVSYPINIVLDSAGAVYFTDYYNNCIRKIDASGGNISTIAGSPANRGYAGDGGPANKALLADPYALAIDATGNLYFSETGNQTIRKIDKSGNISTVVSNVMTESIAVDAAGAIYFTDNPASVIRKVLPGGGPRIVIAGTGVAGYSGDSGPADIAQINQPNGIAIDSAGKLLIADSSNYVIRQLVANPFSVAAATNSASNLQQPVAPGEIVTLYGAGIGPSTLTSYQVTNGVFDNLVAGTQVFVSGFKAPIVYVSATQLAIVIPYGINGPTVDITVVYQGQVASTIRVPVVAASPGIFTSDSTGQGQAAAVNADGVINSPAQAAKPGSFVAFYITGDGRTTPAGVDGKIVSGTLPYTVLPVTATVGGKSALVSYAGGAPGNIAGLTQVNVQIPAGIPSGTAVPVAITVGGVSSQTVTIAVSN